MAEPLARQTFPPRAVVFREGEAGDCAYVIETGQVEISALRQGKETVLAVLADGELFGEMALVDQQVRSATAKTLVTTTLVVINREQVQSKIASADPWLSLFLKVTMERLRTTNQRLAEMTGIATAAAVPKFERSYDVDRDRAMTELRAEQELQLALERRQLEVFFQPIVALQSGDTAGFEALVRWRHPERGLVPPMHFIGLAEKTGIIVPMGAWVLEDACLSLGRLQPTLSEAFPGRHPAFMGVNLSVRQILTPGLTETVAAVLERTRMSPPSLKLEVTESVLMEDPERAIDVLGQLKALGVELAVDDFGTGYSSLSYLRRFPIDVLKVDKSFVSTMLTDTGNLKIVRAITSLARELGMRTVAEGIERNEELVVLRDLGCDYGQGYLYSKPVSLADSNRMILQRLGPQS